MKRVSRNLHVKRVTYRAKKDSTSNGLPTADEMVRGIFAKATSVGERHHPAPENLRNGHTCVCFDNFSDVGGAVTFKVYVYIHGHTPEQLVPDLAAKHIEVTADPLQTEDGKAKAVALVFHALAFGETLIFEYVSGSGGIGALMPALAAMAKRRVDRRLAEVRAVNIPSRKLALMIKQKGGVAEARAVWKGAKGTADSAFSKTLTSVMKGMRNAGAVTTTWVADDKAVLEESDVLELWSELDVESGITSVSLKFGDGSTQDDIEKYQEKRPVTVQAVRDGIPVTTEMFNELRMYLADLMSPGDGGRIIDDKGFFIAG